MIPNVVRGADTSGLVAYLFGEGRQNEHTDPHIVAGHPELIAVHGMGALAKAQQFALARDLDEPRVMFGTEVRRRVREVDPETGVESQRYVDANVWHCSLSLHASEGELSDAEWQAIASDFVRGMGFAENEEDVADCRWIAVRHGLSKNGNDHVHIVVSLVREDGSKASVHHDFSRSQRVCAELEAAHGLKVLESRELGHSARGERPAERAIADKQRRPEVAARSLERVVRAAAVSSSNEADFVRMLRVEGVLVRPRFAEGSTDVVVGYSVALRPEKAQQPAWHGGGRLARDLTLPRLREGWPDSIDGAQQAADEWRRQRVEHAVQTPAGERRISPAMWDRYSAELGQVASRMAAVPLTDTAQWAHTARDVAGVFAAWSRAVETRPGPLADLSRELARTAHQRARESKPKQQSSAPMMGAALLMAQAGTSNPMQAVMLVRQLMKTAQAVAEMHRELAHAQRASQLQSAIERALVDVHERLSEYAGAGRATGASAVQEPALPKVPAYTEEARAAGISEDAWRAMHGGFGGGGNPLSRPPRPNGNAPEVAKPRPAERSPERGRDPGVGL